MTHDDRAFLQELLATKVDIRDGAALTRLNEAGLVSYLAAHGWRKTRDVLSRGRGSTKKPPLGSDWVKEQALVFVPARDLGDRMARTSDLLADLERAEQRSQLLIYRDLLIASQTAEPDITTTGEV